MSLASIRKALGSGYVVATLGEEVFIVIADQDGDEAQANVPAPQAARGKAAAKAAPEPVEEEEDDDDGADEAARLGGLSLAALKKEAVAAGYDAASLKGLSKDDIIEALLAEGEDEEEEESDDEEDEEEEAEDDEADDDGDDDDDDDALSEEDLNAMSLAEVKTLAKEYGLKIKPGTSKDDIIASILDLAGEDEDDAPPF